MKAISILLIIVGIVIFIISLLGGGLLFVLPIPSYYGSIMWFVGVILVALGLYLGNKSKKSLSCRSCGRPIPPNANVCPYCGFKL